MKIITPYNGYADDGSPSTDIWQVKTKSNISENVRDIVIGPRPVNLS